MVHIHTDDITRQFLLESNEYGRVFEWQLSELVPCDKIDMYLQMMHIGNQHTRVIHMVFYDLDKKPLEININSDDILALHPRTREPLFRGERLIQEEILPALKV